MCWVCLTTAAKKKSSERGMLPVTVKQILEATTSEDDVDGFLIDGRETTQITFICQIIEVCEAVRALPGSFPGPWL